MADSLLKSMQKSFTTEDMQQISRVLSLQVHWV